MPDPDFLYDDLDLPEDKVDSAGGSTELAGNPERKWSANDATRVLQALRSIQSYLRANTLDLSTTVTAKDLDLAITTDPAVGPEMDYAGHRGRWFIGVDVANSPTSRDFVLTGQRGTYSFSDGVTTNGSPTLTSASGANFVSGLIGATISGAGIPSGTTVLAVGGLTSLTMSANATASATGVTVTITRSSVQDLLYWKHRGALSATLGVGVTPPDGSARLQVSPPDDEPAMGAIRLRRSPSQTGKVLTIYDSGNNETFWVDKDYYVSGVHGLGVAIVFQGDQTNNRPWAIVDKNKAAGSLYGFEYPSGGTGEVRFRYFNGNKDVFQVGTDGTLFIYQPITIQLLATFQTSLKGAGARAAAPSTGTHVAGEIVFNADPIAGGKVGWVCVTGGSPGTWKAFGAIDA